MTRRSAFYSGLCFFVFSFGACSAPQTNSSDVFVTDVKHTAVKRQAISNCAMYGRASWLESLLYKLEGEELDISESYWTYWYWYELISTIPSLGKVTPFASWKETGALISKYGWVLESEFIAEDAGQSMSSRQADALDYINLQLQPGGRLATSVDRTEDNLRNVLNEAFGADMSKADVVKRSAEETIVARSGGVATSLQETISGSASQRWVEVDFPSVSGRNPAIDSNRNAARKDILLRVLRALNAGEPVVMSVFLDFNARDNADQTFKGSLLKDSPGKQGSHLLVLSDYVVDHVPGYGRIGEGTVSEEMKEAALQGDLVLLKAKNSWGTNRSENGITDGYIRFDYDYLMSQVEKKSIFGSEFSTALLDFVLPPGY